jgi:hypothetical protein
MLVFLRVMTIEPFFLNIDNIVDISTQNIDSYHIDSLFCIDTYSYLKKILINHIDVQRH